MKVLVFPCNTFEAICKAQELKLAGVQVVGATSVASEYKLDEAKYDALFELPFITSDYFKRELMVLLEANSIDYIWSSIASVNRQLPSYLTSGTAQLLSAAPVPLYHAPIQLIKQQVSQRQAYQQRLLSGLSIQDKASTTMLANLLLAIHKVPGESHFDKLFTVANLFPTVPSNTDIVEIGSLWGRTAKAFCCLSQIYDKGKVLCIDPWSSGEAVTQNSHKILDELSLTCDGDAHFAIFVANLVAEHYSKINYLRGFSAQVVGDYMTPKGEVESEEFGLVHYQKKIGLLHIDGNHKYENVIEDIENYASHVVAGGWIIFDDYNWAYGDGVTRAADEYLHSNKAKIEIAFFSGGALFVKLSSAV